MYLHLFLECLPLISRRDIWSDFRSFLSSFRCRRKTWVPTEKPGKQVWKICRTNYTFFPKWCPTHMMMSPQVFQQALGRLCLLPYMYLHGDLLHVKYPVVATQTDLQAARRTSLLDLKWKWKSKFPSDSIHLLIDLINNQCRHKRSNSANLPENIEKKK